MEKSLTYFIRELKKDNQKQYGIKNQLDFQKYTKKPLAEEAVFESTQIFSKA